jgi:hypothetical protein
MIGISFRHWKAVASLLRCGLHAFWQPWVWAPILAVTLLVYKNTIVLPTEGEPAELGSTSVLQFDGTDDRVTVPYDTTFPTEVFTASAWIKLALPAGRAAIIARGEDDNSFNLSWQLYVTRDGTLEVMLEDARERNYCYPLNNCAPMGTCAITGELFVADDAWHHVAVSRDESATLALYIDGEKQAGCEGTGAPSSNNSKSCPLAVPSERLVLPPAE